MFYMVFAYYNYDSYGGLGDMQLSTKDYHKARCAYLKLCSNGDFDVMSLWSCEDGEFEQLEWLKR